MINLRAGPGCTDQSRPNYWCIISPPTSESQSDHNDHQGMIQNIEKQCELTLTASVW